MTSNSTYTWMFKYVFLIPALLMFGIGIEGYLAEDSVIINGESTSLGIYALLVMLILGIVFIIICLSYKDNVVKVKIGGQNITIYEDGEEELINWMEVESLRQLIFIEPPLYKLRIRNREGYYLFTTQPASSTAGPFKP